MLLQNVLSIDRPPPADIVAYIDLKLISICLSLLTLVVLVKNVLTV